MRLHIFTPKNRKRALAAAIALSAAFGFGGCKDAGQEEAGTQISETTEPASGIGEAISDVVKMFPTMQAYAESSLARTQEEYINQELQKSGQPMSIAITGTEDRLIYTVTVETENSDALKESLAAAIKDLEANDGAKLAEILDGIKDHIAVENPILEYRYVDQDNNLLASAVYPKTESETEFDYYGSVVLPEESAAADQITTESEAAYSQYVYDSLEEMIASEEFTSSIPDGEDPEANITQQFYVKDGNLIYATRFLKEDMATYETAKEIVDAGAIREPLQTLKETIRQYVKGAAGAEVILRFEKPDGTPIYEEKM